MGFPDVYDYVGSKMDWMAAGLPYSGTAAARPALGGLAQRDVPTCAMDELSDEVAGRMGDWPVGLVVNAERVVLGLVRAEALAVRHRPVGELMQEGPSTYRPNVSAAELAPKLERHPVPYVIVTTLDGRLVGVADPAAIRSAAGAAGEDGGSRA